MTPMTRSTPAVLADTIRQGVLGALQEIGAAATTVEGITLFFVQGKYDGVPNQSCDDPIAGYLTARTAADRVSVSQSGITAMHPACSAVHVDLPSFLRDWLNEFDMGRIPECIRERETYEFED